MEFTANDHRFMAKALRLAECGRLSADPNPAVGCVIVNDDQIVGQGFHRVAGESHAEIHALREAGLRAKGSCVYVTLEPCAHHGRTPPCAQALIEADVETVVAAMVDPHPETAGLGLELLAKAGIQVRSGLMETAARALNAGFISRFERNRPWLRVKLATSFDGATAGPDGQSQWITGAAAREDVQRWRARASCVLTGIETILADDPQLTLRYPGVDRTPLRVVIDSRARMPNDARMLSLNGPVLIASAAAAPWQRDGVEWIKLPKGDDDRINLNALMDALVEREVNDIHVEAGPTLAGALVEAGLVDELLVYQAPVLIGQGAPMLKLPGIESFAQRHHLTFVESRRVGADWRHRFIV